MFRGLLVEKRDLIQKNIIKHPHSYRANIYFAWAYDSGFMFQINYNTHGNRVKVEWRINLTRFDTLLGIRLQDTEFAFYSTIFA